MYQTKETQEREYYEKTVAANNVLIEKLDAKGTAIEQLEVEKANLEVHKAHP